MDIKYTEKWLLKKDEESKYIFKKVLPTVMAQHRQVSQGTLSVE